MTPQDKLKRLAEFDSDEFYKKSGMSYAYLEYSEGAEWENKRLKPLLDALIECVGGLDKIRSGGDRAEIFGLELYRCPTCASAEIASEALANLERVVKEME